MLRSILSAFNARPFGLMVPPAWLAAIGVGLLWLVDPGVCLLAAGGLLAILVVVSWGPSAPAAPAAPSASQRALIESLDDDDELRYHAHDRRCTAVVEHLRRFGSRVDMRILGERVGQLQQTYLQLLLARQAMKRHTAPAADDGSETPEAKLAGLQAQLQGETPIPDDVRASISSQVRTLQERIRLRAESRERLPLIEAELARLQEQTELLREQAATATEPAVMIDAIDRVFQSLGGTNRVIQGGGA